MQLRGLPLLVADCFRKLGVGVAVWGARGTGPVLEWHLKVGRNLLRRLPHLPNLERRVRAVSTRVAPLALHRVAAASVADRDLQSLETMVLRAVWEATRLSRAKDTASPR